MKDVYLDDILYGKKGNYDPEDRSGYGFGVKKDKKKKKKKDRDSIPNVKKEEDVLDMVSKEMKKEKKKKNKHKNEERVDPKMKEIDDIVVTM